MRVRPNIFVVSSLLLTPTFFWLLPSTIECVRYKDPVVTDMTQAYGFASLTVIIVGLIVIWTGLAVGKRVAWVIVAVITWVWAFPIMIWPLQLRHILTLIVTLSLSELSDWVTAAWHGEHLSRIALVNTVMFLLMLVGLILPVRALLRSGKPKLE